MKTDKENQIKSDREIIDDAARGDYKYGFSTDITTDIIYNAETGRIETTTDKPYRLNVNGKTIKVKKGKYSYPLPPKYIR